jgi:dihydropyrimidine dehydrogenase (NAD+) subunit PreA
VWVKLTPNVTDIVTIARAAHAAGASAVTAINNLRALAGVNIETQEPLPSVDGLSTYGGYAGPGLKPVGLRCVAEIAQALDVPIIGTGGIESWEDAIEYLLVGASLVQVYTPVMEHGFGLINALVAGLQDYLGRHAVAKVSALTGRVLPRLVAHSGLPRRTGQGAAFAPDLCTRCGLCRVACADSGFQAIRQAADGLPMIDRQACDACGLCVELCPVSGCMWVDG